MTFRVGHKNPHTIYWSCVDEEDHFVGIAMTPAFAAIIAFALNEQGLAVTTKHFPAHIDDLPTVEKP